MESCKSMYLESSNQNESNQTDDKVPGNIATSGNDTQLDILQKNRLVKTGQPAKTKQMAEVKQEVRTYDLVIFAASGSLGKFLVEEMALVVDKYYSGSQQAHNLEQQVLGGTALRNPMQFAQARRVSVPRSLNDISWAIAGRSAMKLNETLCQAELSTGIKGLSSRVPIILADLNHYKSLLEMCQKTSVVMNCAGPYSVDGEAIIRACVETKTNYIDLSHETTFIEQVRLRYSSQARDAGICIINGCGFQSMSVEMGLNFVKQVVDGKIDEVKIILNLSDTKALIRPSGSDNQLKQCGIVSPGMWNSYLIEQTQGIRLVEDVARRKGVKAIESSSTGGGRRPLMRKDTQIMVRDMVEFKNRNSLAWLQLIKGFDESDRGYCVPLNSLTSEEAQLIRGEMAYYEQRKPDLGTQEGWKPIRCTSFMSMRSLSEVILVLIWIIIFNVIARRSSMTRIMRALPTIASLGQVSNRRLERDSLSHIKFCQTFLAYGTPGEDSGDPLEQREKSQKRKQEKLLVARVVGPEPNHVATATFAIQAALTVISERDHLPMDAGVLTPGSAFVDTNIIYQLRRRNIKFEVLKKA